ncbi:MAG: hypothetical protein IM600_12715 [Bacteroidetes bacterium]|nr:hypothetical protein [Bacteroidota bacterium]MCA6444285.1 hypothetical protein [Bacteroidota bacterium]
MKLFVLMPKHDGEILANAIRQSGYPMTKLASRIGYTRQHLYNLFEKRKLSAELLLQVGKVIQYDFTKDINKKSFSQSSEIDTEDNVDYKELYFSLLEQQNKLLKENYNLLKSINKKLMPPNNKQQK